MWAVAILLSVFMFARVLGDIAEHVGIEVGPVAGPVAGRAVVTTNDNAALPATLRQFEQTLGSSGDPTTMSHDQIAAEIRSLAGEDLARTGAIPDTDRTRLVALVAAQYGLTKDEATQRVARLESEAKARLARIEERGRAAVEEVARGTQSAARALFTSLTLGLLAALLGAWVGTRHKRVLHPEEAHVPVYAQPSHLAAPLNVTLYEDEGHLVAQYLRGVTFPVSKQDLLRFARAGAAGPDLLRAIERLGDRSYANANEVLAAFGVVH
jgi:hypothetical protein